MDDTNDSNSALTTAETRLLMYKGAELEAECTMDGNSADTGCAENPAPKYIPQLVKHLAECDQVDTSDKALQRCLRRNNRRCPQEESDGRAR